MRPSRGTFIGIFGACALAAGLLAGCGGGGGSAPSVATSPSGIPTPSSFSAQQSVVVTQPGAIPLPTGGGYGGSVTISSAAGNPLFAEAIGSSPQSGTLPALDLVRLPAGTRGALAIAFTPLVYLELASSVTLAFSDAPAITLCVPSAVTSVAGAAYYLAYYDLTRPSLGWQLGFEGPADETGTTCSPNGTLAFAAPSPAVPFTLAAEVPAYFALYGQATSAATPTPAPVASTTPVAVTTPAPFALASPSVSLLGAGQTANVTITDPTAYSGGYALTEASGGTSVATATVSGKTITVTAVGAGQTTFTVSDTNARTATLSVGVTITNGQLQ